MPDLADIFTPTGHRQFVDVPTRGDNRLDVVQTTVYDLRVSEAGLV